MATYSLVTDFNWLSIDENTGVISVNSTEYISGRFPVVVVEDDAGTITNHDISLSVYFDEDTVMGKSESPVFNYTDHDELVKSANQYGAVSMPKTPTSNYYNWLFPYREDYSTLPIDLVFCEDEFGVVTQSTNDNTGYALNNISLTRSDEWIGYIYSFSGTDSKRRVITWNPSDNAMNFDAVELGVEFGGEEAHLTVHPITRDFIHSGVYNGFAHIGRIDTATNISTYIGQVGTTARLNPRSLDVGAGQDMLYAVVGREPTTELYSMALDGSTSTLIVATTDSTGDIDIIQLAGGVVVVMSGVEGYTDGLQYYVYNGELTALANNSDYVNAPWPSTGLYEYRGSEKQHSAPASSGYPEPSVPSTGVTSATVITDGVSTTFNYTVRTYSYRLFSMIKDSNDNLFIASGDSAEVLTYNPITRTTIDRSPLVPSKTKSVLLSNGDIVYGGYSSAVTYLKTSNEDTYTLLGLAGGGDSGSLSHYYCGIERDNEDTVYCIGVQYRIGDSGGIGWFNPYDFENTLTGLNPADFAPMQDYGFSGSTKIGDKIIISAYLIATATATKSALFIFDMTTKTFDPIIELFDDIAFTGAIIKVSNTDIFGITALSDGTSSAVIYRVNTVTGEVIYRRNLGDMRYMMEQQPTGASEIFNQLVVDDEGFIYTVIDRGSTAEVFLAKIDPSIGGVELLGTVPTNENCLEIINGNLYCCDFLKQFREVQKVDMPTTLPPSVLETGVEVMTYPDLKGAEFGAGSAWSNDATAGTWTFNRANGDTYFYKGNLGLEAGETYEVNVNIESITATSNNYLNFSMQGAQYYPTVGVFKTIVLMPSVLTGNELNISSFNDVTGAVINSISIKKLVNALAEVPQ